jgi:hypothetical protein
VLTINPAANVVELPIFCNSECPSGYNFIITLSYLVSFGAIKETVTQKWCKALQR